MSKLTDTFTIGGNYDGTLSVTSSATGVATVSRSGNTVTVSHVHQTNGEATITVSCTAGTNYSAPASKTVKVTAEFILATLNDNSWAAIHSVSGTGASYWAIGDRKAVTVNGTVGTQAVNGTYYAYIIGFNHNSSKEGNGITFGTFKTALSGGTDICLVDGNYGGYSTNGTKYFNMNHSSNTNAGGWKGCDLRYDVLGSTNTNDGDATATTATNPVANTLMAALPSDLRAVMQPMTIYTDNTGGGSDNASYVTKTTDYLPLLAEYEIFGTRSYANSAEKNYQAQYAYYSAGNSKVKYRHSATGSTAWWWERSPYYDYSSTFCSVDTNGYYVIVPPDRDAKEIMALIVAKAEGLKLTVSKSKSRIVPLTKPFRYCKAKFILTETGRVVMNGNRDGVKRARRKIKAFRTKIQNGEMSYDDLWTSVNGMLAYFESYDDHNRVLRLRRLFYSIFGFSPERIENFRERGKKDEICCA